MVAISDKAKQFLFVIIKVLIVGGAFYFIYQKLSNNPKLDWQKCTEAIHNSRAMILFLVALLLAFLNRFFEILKWQNLVGTFQRISLGSATRQVLGGLTAGIFTPNGVGEYAGKALYFEKTLTKKILFLNLVCNGAQMIITVVFGFFGLLYFNVSHHVITPGTVIFVFAAVCTGLFALFMMKRFSIKGYSLEKGIHKINALPKNTHRRNMALAVARYLFFSHQQYIMLLCFDVHLPYFLIMATIAATYFLASCLPSFQFLDFAVKGGVAVLFFGILGVNEWIVVLVTTLMWLLNVVIPVIIGSYFVLRFKQTT
ncbi:lysylphosphatidylglycerol synthase domain-containing protein [Flavobacterium pallidum]|uniref:Lysylphosphatidylglycerol synthetase n=1 Tax=Flavobacterium pallidum TaxID=2172098 RepID=A0A2S1SEB2_9FLAO|nr:lysylphosphatidylglycerol synthase domain-containing protein [Flavobacterium pallidum]AWI24748.1 hypothetical protein HYN49_01945 [Flavobacterium pallidum]